MYYFHESLTVPVVPIYLLYLPDGEAIVSTEHYPTISREDAEPFFFFFLQTEYLDWHLRTERMFGQIWCLDRPDGGRSDVWTHRMLGHRKSLDRPDIWTDGCFCRSGVSAFRQMWLTSSTGSVVHDIFGHQLRPSKRHVQVWMRLSTVCVGTGVFCIKIRIGVSVYSLVGCVVHRQIVGVVAFLAVGGRLCGVLLQCYIATWNSRMKHIQGNLYMVCVLVCGRVGSLSDVGLLVCGPVGSLSDVGLLVNIASVSVHCLVNMIYMKQSVKSWNDKASCTIRMCFVRDIFALYSKSIFAEFKVKECKTGMSA